MMTISVLVEFYYFDSFFVLLKFWRKTFMQMNDCFLEKSTEEYLRFLDFF